MVNFLTTRVALVLTLESCLQHRPRARTNPLLALRASVIVGVLIFGFGVSLNPVTTTVAVNDAS